ncbi:MAG TPA: hypothetical protein PKV71_01370 [Calditrichia bacterium]|nr:hypothetical protein [Calditrichota bacterium]HQV30490.1 hypothetical protein [Calditrichia bacterium]
MKLWKMAVLTLLLTTLAQAQQQYPRIVGDLGFGASLQFESALGEFSDFAGSGIGFAGVVEYAMTPRWVLNLWGAYQGFGGDSPDTLILANRVYFKDDLDASNTVTSVFLGTRFFSHPQAKIQLFAGGKVGLERIATQLKDKNTAEDIETVISEEKKFRLALSPELGVRYNNRFDFSLFYSTFSDGSYWGLQAGVFFPVRKW